MPAVFFVMTVSVLTCATMRGYVMTHASNWKLLDSPNPKGLDSPTKVHSPNTTEPNRAQPNPTQPSPTQPNPMGFLGGLGDLLAIKKSTN